MARPRLRYEDYIQSDRWQRKRLQAIRWYRGRCMICGEKGATEVHHATYVHLGRERIHELLLVHHECHEAITAWRRARKQAVSLEEWNEVFSPEPARVS